MTLWAFDTETYLITKTDKAPKPVVCSWYNGMNNFLTLPSDEMTLQILSDPNAHFVGHNMAYDLGVMMRWHPVTIPLIVRALEEGRVWDTQIREQLQHLHNVGEREFPKFISLAKLEEKYLGLDRSAQKKGEDTWRLKYGTLDGVPLANWPAAAVQYALDDTKGTYDVFMMQGGPQGFYNTEQLQNQASLALHLTSVWGMGTNPENVAKVKKRIEEKMAGLKAQLDAFTMEATVRRTVTKNKQKQVVEEVKTMGIVGKGTNAALHQLVLQGWQQKHMKDLSALAEKEKVYIVWENIMPHLNENVDLGLFLLQSNVQWCYDSRLWNPPDFIKKAQYAIKPVTRTSRGPKAGSDDIQDILEFVPILKVRSDYKHEEKMLATYVTPYENTQSIHASFNVMMGTGRTSCSSPNCYSMDTEVLTNEGWFSFNVLEKMHNKPQIAQYDHLKHKVSFYTTGADDWYFSQDAHDMLTFNKEHIDLACTSDHRCLVRNRKNNKFSIVKADSIPLDCHVLNSPLNSQVYGLEEDKYNMLRLALAIQADGHIIDAKNDKEVSVDFSFHKNRKYKRLLSLLDIIGIEYKDYTKGKRYRIKFSVATSVLCLYMDLATKKLKASYLLNDINACQIVVEEVYNWDGCFERQSMYASKEKENADFVQIAHLMCGDRVNVRKYINGRGSVSWQVDVTKRPYTGTANVKKSTLSGRVACATVSTGMLIVRRGGKTLICGNTQNIPRGEGFRHNLRARAGYLLGTVDYSALEMVTFAATIVAREGRSAMADAINQGKDLHCLTASGLFGHSYEKMLEEVAKEKKQKRAGHTGPFEFSDMRQGSKALNFGGLGGLGAKAFQPYAKFTYGVDWTEKECAKRIRQWKSTWPEVALYLAKNSEACENTDGNRATATNNMGREKANCSYTQLCNYPFQSLAADGVKASMWELLKHQLLGWFWTYASDLWTTVQQCMGEQWGIQHLLYSHSPLRESHIVNMVHDELVMEHPEHLAQEAFALQQKIMVDTMRRYTTGVEPSVEGELGIEWEH